jgi:hypothetical protein
LLDEIRLVSSVFYLDRPLPRVCEADYKTQHPTTQLALRLEQVTGSAGFVAVPDIFLGTPRGPHSYL